MATPTEPECTKNMRSTTGHYKNGTKIETIYHNYMYPETTYLKLPIESVLLTSNLKKYLN